MVSIAIAKYTTVIIKTLIICHKSKHMFYFLPVVCFIEFERAKAEIANDSPKIISIVNSKATLVCSVCLKF